LIFLKIYFGGKEDLIFQNASGIERIRKLCVFRDGKYLSRLITFSSRINNFYDIVETYKKYIKIITFKDTMFEGRNHNTMFKEHTGIFPYMIHYNTLITLFKIKKGPVST
jgi:hypothetical protein